eukprot:jgi/Mesvir1/18605/Mv17114-RA.1
MQAGDCQVYRPIPGLKDVLYPGDIVVRENKYVNLKDLLKAFSNGKKTPAKFMASNTAKEKGAIFMKEKGFSPIYNMLDVEFSFAVHVITWANPGLSVFPPTPLFKTVGVDGGLLALITEATEKIKRESSSLLTEFAAIVKTASDECYRDLEIADKRNEEIWQIIAEFHPHTNLAEVANMYRVSLGLSRDIYSKRMEAATGAFWSELQLRRGFADRALASITEMNAKKRKYEETELLVAANHKEARTQAEEVPAPVAEVADVEPPQVVAEGSLGSVDFDVPQLDPDVVYELSFDELWESAFGEPAEVMVL